MTDIKWEPPRSTILTALYLAIMFRALLDGLKIGQVRHGGLPSCPIRDRAARSEAVMRRMSCVAIWDPRGVNRSSSWTGAVRRVVVRGLDLEFLKNCPLEFDLPPTAAIYEVPAGANARHVAAEIEGAVFTVPALWYFGDHVAPKDGN
jgi:hypothetical protein